MIEAQKELEDLPNKNMPSLGRAGYTKKLKKDISKYHNFQLVRKIQLNSAYGAIGNEFFRYFNVDMAEAITMSGQLSIQYIANELNAFLNKTLDTGDYDYVVASDTDSVYLRLGNLVDKVCPNKSKSQVVEFLNKSCAEIIQPFIDKSYKLLAEQMNAYENKMVMEREVIADVGIWTAKKRYMLNVHDSEGIRYDTPKLKIMGIETTRSSTPQIARSALKETIALILTGTEPELQAKVEEIRQEFMVAAPEEIAFPRSCNGLAKYSNKSTIYEKGTPIAVKGSLLFNHYLKKHKLTKKYETINEGEKIKFLYLKSPNPFGGIDGKDHVISFVSTLPKEFDIIDFIDYEKQFEKSFLDPLRNILDVVEWDYEKRASLEDFFG
jgi:DNA polymerase elongation subunit (family B)